MSARCTSNSLSEDTPQRAQRLTQALLEETRVICSIPRCSSLLVELLLEAPRCAALVSPGQFVHVEVPDLEAHILRRPLSVYKADATKGTLSLMYQVVGEGTRRMTDLREGTPLSIIGPLGRGWDFKDAQSCLLVGGGVGAAPLLMLAQKLVQQNAQVEAVLGAGTADMLTCQEDFEHVLGAEHVHITTDDGSRGHRGFTTEVAKALIASHDFDYAATCGPEPMQQRVGELTKSAAIQTEVSLERRMACGIGACLGCTVETHEGKKRACVDGPVFAAEEVLW